jgi:hypothetical protein
MPTPATGPIDVSLSLFSSLVTETSPTDLPEGLSPDNQDVVFVPGSVASRAGLHKLFLQAFAGNSQVNFLDTYRQANGQPLNLYLDSLGVLRTEDVVNSSGKYQPIGQVAAGCFCTAVTHDNKKFFAFHDGVHPLDIPRQFDGTFFDRVSQDGPAAQVTAADSLNAGSISAGAHQVVVMFLTRQGYLTKPSQPFSWTAAGNKKVLITNLPIGPPNVIARVLAFTGSGGANFFTILGDSNVAGGTIVAATLIADNTSLQVELDFSDNALFDAEGIDIPGNNLFNLVVLAPSAGVESFAGRLFWWNEWNKIQGFLNMGFEGGTAAVGGAVPLSWDASANAGGALVGSPSDFGLAWQITGDGSLNPRGLIAQAAFENYLLNPILEPSTLYTFVFWAKSQVANQVGTFFAEFFSPTRGSLGIAQLPVANIPNANGAFVQAQFSTPTPAVIPADTVLRIYAIGMANGQTLAVDELMTVFAEQPYRENDFRVSYSTATGSSPESYDGVTGDLGPESDSAPLRVTGKIRDTLCFVTAAELHETRDNGSEPGDWDVRRVQGKVGAVSSRCMAQGTNWLAWVSQNDTDLSLVIYAGSDCQVISQEIQPNFSLVNQDQMQTIWAVNDAGAKRIYIGAPSGQNLLPSLILPMDYRSLPTADSIATNGPIHIGLPGKMIASDRVRKWTVWNLPMNCGGILNRSLNRKTFCVGSGGAGFGNAYYFDSAKLTDDDYGAMNPYWTSYFFVNHEMEMALPVGVHRKLYDKLALFMTGVGYPQITPLVDRLDNPQQFTTRAGGPAANTIVLKQALKRDMEIPGEVGGERVAFKIGVAPIPQGKQGYTNGTDVQFNLQHLSCRMQAHPVSPLSGYAGG